MHGQTAANSRVGEPAQLLVLLITSNKRRADMTVGLFARLTFGKINPSYEQICMTFSRNVDKWAKEQMGGDLGSRVTLTFELPKLTGQGGLKLTKHRRSRVLPLPVIWLRFALSTVNRAQRAVDCVTPSVPPH